MNDETSSRRLFFRRAGAALAIPLTVGATAASATPLPGNEGLEARLKALDDANAIRELNQAYARLLNARAYDDVASLFADPAQALADRSICGLSSQSFGARDVIEIAADGLTATALIHCTVQIETPIEPGSTLVEMARAQGEGVVRRSEKRVIENRYVKQHGRLWKIVQSAYRPA